MQLELHLLGRLPGYAAPFVQLLGEEDVVPLVAVAVAGCEAAEVGEPTGPITRLLFELPPGSVMSSWRTLNHEHSNT
jgi:hypothetical protein